MLYEISYKDNHGKEVIVGVKETKDEAYAYMSDYAADSGTHNMPYTIRELEGCLH